MSRPRYSIVVAVYNVGRYLDEFFASVEGQNFDLSLIEVVAVDDGSTDDSLQRLQTWRDNGPLRVIVLSKQNGGQGSARNLGLQHATGDWATFTDPDDLLDANYFKRVDECIVANPGVEFVATNRIIFNESNGKIHNGHPLRKHFAGGDQVVNLNRFPEYFHGSAPAAFMRLKVIQEHALTFDDRIQPNFEDGHFCCQYLLAVPAPVVAFLASARYIYRKRGDQSSTLQNSNMKPTRFTDVPEHGYLDVLKRGQKLRGAVPEWLQNFILYELSWYFTAEDAATNSATAATGQTGVRFRELLAELSQYFEPEVVRGFSVRRFDGVWRDIMLHAFSPEPWHSEFAVLEEYDEARNLVKIVYRFTGELPTEEILIKGKPIRPTFQKIRAHSYFGDTLIRARVIWVPVDGSLRIRLGGRIIRLQRTWPTIPMHSVRPSALKRMFVPRSSVKAARRRPRVRLKRPRIDRISMTRRLAESYPVRHVFADSWILMDRIHDSDDNAERLFRYLRKRRRSVNAWFVVEKDTPDWHRLKAEGYRRILPHGGLLWKLAMYHCQHLISSHIDVDIVRPPQVLELRKANWNFVFLQHGVIKDDISRWLNAKKIDLFVTSTPGEFESIAGDNSPYKFTSKEVRLTGLPRFDRLREVGRAIPPERRDLILVAPTWRNWLNVPNERGVSKRVIRPDFLDTEYAQNWIGLLQDPTLTALAQERGLTLAFLPHPNMQDILKKVELPRHVQPMTFVDNDVQELFARAAVTVTDYSSMAFNAAYIDRPLVYFQFDKERVDAGGHLGKSGYFDYETDGFGPVTYDLGAAIQAVTQQVDETLPNRSLYSERVAATFPLRDGRCCERVWREIEAMP